MRTAQISTLYQTLPQLQMLQKSQNAQQEQLVSGRKFNRVEENPIAARELLTSRIERESLAQLRNNTVVAEGIANTGLQAMDYLKSIADQALSVASDASMRNQTGASRVSQLIDDALSIANTRHRDEYIFAGSETGIRPFTIDDSTGELIYDGQGDGPSFEVAGSTTVSPYASAETVGAVRNFIENLQALHGALASGDELQINEVVPRLYSSEDSLIEGAGEFSFKLTRMSSLKARDAAKYSALDQRETEVLAVDTTEVVVNLLNSQKAYQAALQSLASINKISLLNYL